MKQRRGKVTPCRVKLTMLIVRRSLHVAPVLRPAIRASIAGGIRVQVKSLSISLEQVPRSRLTVDAQVPNKGLGLAVWEIRKAG